ncbi:MAG: hypothetical protein RLZZ59_284 [Pseudomonadota bacterium]|jgi:opacity protein-like surface antigen
MKKITLLPLLYLFYTSNASAIMSDLMYIRGDITSSKFNNISLGDEKYKHNYNFGGVVGLGYYWDDKTRLELVYNNMLADRFKYSTRKDNLYVRMTANIHAGFIRGIRDVLEVGNTRFFVGAGAGMANVNHKVKGFLDIEDDQVGAPPVIQSVNASVRSPRKNNFAYNLMFGASIKVTENLHIDTSYTFMDYGRTASLRHSSVLVGGAATLRSHNITLGFRFDLI